LRRIGLSSKPPDNRPKQIGSLPDEERRAAETGNGTAENELAQLATERSVEDLQDQARRNEHKRDQKFRDHFERLSLIGMWLTAMVIAVLGVVWVYHLISPDSWPQLSDAKVRNLQNLVTAGVLVGAVGKHWSKRLG
jgi:hypothetical protein